MVELLWFLLPVAAASGWWIGRRSSGSAGQLRVAYSPEYFKGLNFLLNEQQDEALEVFLRMAEVDSEVIETHLALGNLFRRRGEVDRAIRIHQNLMARPNLGRQERAHAIFELARDYMKAGLLDRSEKLFRELLDWIASMQQHARVAIDVGDGRLAGRRGDETRVVGKETLSREIADVDDVWTQGALQHRQIHGRVC